MDETTPADGHQDHEESNSSQGGLEARRRIPGRALVARMVARPVLAIAVAGAVGLAGLGGAAWLHLEASALRKPTNNIAVVDTAATKQVSTAISTAIERVYGYSYESLDADERAAREVVTGPFAQEFREQFATVRELAPKQKAEVTATVSALAVRSITGDRAEVLAFVDQTLRNTKLQDPASNGARLVVTAERVDGRWKIAAVASK